MFINNCRIPLINALKPYDTDSYKRITETTGNDIDQKICELYDFILTSPSKGGRRMQERMTLLHVKVVLDLGEGLARKLNEYLEGELGLVYFKNASRISLASQTILKMIFLSDFRTNIGEKRIFYALAEDEVLAKLPINRIRHVEDIALARLNEIKEKNPKILEKYRAIDFKAATTSEKLNLPLGSLLTLTQKELSRIISDLFPGCKNIASSEALSEVVDFKTLQRTKRNKKDKSNLDLTAFVVITVCAVFLAFVMCSRDPLNTSPDSFA